MSQDPKKALNNQKIVLQAQNSERGMNKNLFLTVISLSVSIIVLLVINSFLIFFNEPENRYFALDNDLRVIELIPTKEPMLSDEKIVRWSNTAINEINSLTFTGWRAELQAQSNKFTDKAFEGFILGLRDSGNLELITSNRLNTIVMLTGGSKITRKGIDPSTGRYGWEVETPFMINYEGSNGVEATQRLLSTIRIVRVSTLEEPLGIKINSYVTALKGR